MIIYIALLIPVFTAIVLYLFFKHKTVWWEFCIPFGASIIFVLSSKFLIEVISTTSQEYWGSFIDRVEYYEDWDEWIEQTCYRSCCCDADGNNCSTESYDCSYRLYHPPIWQIITTTGETVGIDAAEYTRLKSLFGAETFVDMRRDYYMDDGDKYFCQWNKDSISAIPVTTMHYYENRVKAADQSIFHFQEVDTSDIRQFDLKQYPEIYGYYQQDVIIGDDCNDARIANEKFKYINGSLGSKKEMRIYVLVYKNQPVKAALYQEWLWSGANMNEFVICIGIDNERNVKWCYPISWTPAEMLKADVKQFVLSQDKLNLCALADYIYPQIDKQFIRKDFKEFDYLTVEPSFNAILITFILTLFLNTCISIWIIINEYEDGRD